MKITDEHIKTIVAKIVNVDQDKRKVDWFDVLTLINKYEGAIEDRNVCDKCNGIIRKRILS
ncbi:hypothetical protein [Cytobacillus praedii]|uniref:Uncharacterized protein n=1 Tax=Cytobacillus praedii TaxID=1742358 RepID=A0A4R1ALB5_9BACI|nr:hypothetical protein [Cytobacillus praedii]TCI99976.1 hypothetical protein E0Y62_27100 [Cytobacillus praedii]